MYTDNPGHPQQQENQENHAHQTVSFNTAQAAEILDADERTVRRWIQEGRLPARRVKHGRSTPYQIDQTDLEAFKRERDRQATEGQPAGGHLTHAAEESQALTTSTIQIIAVELERRAAELERRAAENERLEEKISELQKTVERLSYEAGRKDGLNEAQTREMEALRQRVAELEQERDQWQKAPESGKALRRVRLFPWQQKED